MKLLLEQYGKDLFEPGELIVLAHLSREAIDEAMLLDVFPPPKKLTRMALLVVHGVDPRLNDKARALVQNEPGAPTALFGVLKFAASLFSAVAGIPGGIFAPSLAVGAGLGAYAAALVPGAPAASLVVLGMVSYFAGVVQAPLTAFVIVSEMTGDHALIVPLMLASLIGYAASRLVCREGVYHALARNYLGSAVRH